MSFLAAEQQDISDIKQRGQRWLPQNVLHTYCNQIGRSFLAKLYHEARAEIEDILVKYLSTFE